MSMKVNEQAKFLAILEIEQIDNINMLDKKFIPNFKKAFYSYPYLFFRNKGFLKLGSEMHLMIDYQIFGENIELLSSENKQQVFSLIWIHGELRKQKTLLYEMIKIESNELLEEEKRLTEEALTKIHNLLKEKKQALHLLLVEREKAEREALTIQAKKQTKNEKDALMKDYLKNMNLRKH